MRASATEKSGPHAIDREGPATGRRERMPLEQGAKVGETTGTLIAIEAQAPILTGALVRAASSGGKARRLGSIASAPGRGQLVGRSGHGALNRRGARFARLTRPTLPANLQAIGMPRPKPRCCKPFYRSDVAGRTLSGRSAQALAPRTATDDVMARPSHADSARLGRVKPRRLLRAPAGLRPRPEATSRSRLRFRRPRAR